MNLCEEYYTRHNIPVSVVKHIDMGSIFFRSKEYPFWKVFRISWRPPYLSPGIFVFSNANVCKHPVEDVLYFDRDNDIKVDWSNYEDYVLNWRKHYNLERFEVVLDSKDVDLFAWEILLFSQEPFVKSKLMYLEKHIFSSIDKNNDLDSRYFSYQTLSKDLMKFDDEDSRRINGIYREQLAVHVDNYLYWLAKLVK